MFTISTNQISSKSFLKPMALVNWLKFKMLQLRWIVAILWCISNNGQYILDEPWVTTTYGVFWRPIDQDHTWQPGQGVAKTAWSSIYGYVTSQHFSLVNQILTFNKKATIYLLKLLLGFKSLLYLIPSTQHTQACVFTKITVQNWYFFLPPAFLPLRTGSWSGSPKRTLISLVDDRRE